MDQLLSRRALIGAGLALPLLALPGCTTLPGFNVEDAVRRLLTLSSQRAFANLLQDEGFFQDEVARVTLPPALGGTGATSVLAALLRTRAVQDQLLRIVNRAAADAADAAAPMVMDSIRSMSIVDAIGIVRGGSTAATSYLQRGMGNAIFDAMLPGVGNALRLLDSGIVSRALGAATGIDFAGLQRDVTLKASDGIYRAIGREEATIRADPQATGDPLLSRVFGIFG
ncbi:DUF4197 domain-containing protein [Sphingosinicella sp. LY1275]|uniref:DUF4197 domain-containing protein n=1 Tax=Sphingosinicella sp. LY1275 TaxID=3095379 RepID=UPI002ADEC446|nr:DUF4197 domain-containing protein [Sphingosinicella sp. LY1275]MEA1013793.1 DUF4197 domain-containing protein [Sphingosinicella sp. LY1275]